MSETAVATAEKVEKKEKGPSPILRGVENGKVTMVLWANPPGAKMDVHGYIAGVGGKNRQVSGFFNEKDGKKSISLKEFVPGAEGKDSWKMLGFGNPVNSRKDSGPVFFDTMVFNIEGKSIGARVTKAGEEFQAKMGFTSDKVARPKNAPEGNTTADTGEAPARPRQRG